MASTSMERRLATSIEHGPSRVPRACWYLTHAAFLLLPLASVLSALILLGLGGYFAWRKIRIEVPIPGKSWSLLMAAVSLSAYASVAPGLSAVAILLFGGYFTVIWVIGLVLDSPERIWSLIRNVFWGTVLWAVVGIVLVWTHTYWNYQSGGIDLRLGTLDNRAASIFYHPNIFSGYLLLVSGLGMMLLIHHRARERVWTALGLGTILICQVLTSSRSGWMGTIATLLLIGLLVDRRILIVLFGGMAVSLLSFWSLIMPRLHTLGQMNFVSNFDRVLVWKSAMRMIGERPFTGWGPGTWSMTYPKFEDPQILEKMPHAHNMYLMIGAEFGLVVLVVLVGVFISLVVKSIRETYRTPWRRHVIILGCTILGYLIVGLFDFIFTEGRNSILFFTMLGVLVAMRRFRPRPARQVKRILFLSNGYGEDRIASAIARRWQVPNTERWAFPIVGAGRAFRSIGLPLVGPTQLMPSGGFILRSARALWQDLQSGLLILTIRQILAMRQLRSEVDLVVAVGDVVPLYFAWLSQAPFVFVGCAKSDYYLGGRFGSYGFFERWFIQHPRCRAVYPRDAVTARNLIARGYRALDHGNPMMDDLDPSGQLWTVPEGTTAIGLLPGSRDEAYENLPNILNSCVAIARRAPGKRPVAFFAAIADSLETVRLAEAAARIGWHLDALEETLVGPQGVAVQLCRGQFGNWLHVVDAVIGMAGTANEQCVGAGKPVITFPGSGPQFNPAFAEAQTRLLGESISMVAADPEAVARELWEILGDDERLERIRKNGRERMGLPGAAERIARSAALLGLQEGSSFDLNLAHFTETAS